MFRVSDVRLPSGRLAHRTVNHRRHPVPAGTLHFGADDGKAVIAWTTDSDLLLNVTQSQERGLSDLYRWWSTHS